MPTEKQKAAAIRIIENHGNVSKTMLEVGYTKASASNPSNLTDSQGWKELMEEYLPDNKLAEKHRALLDKVDSEGGIDVNAVGKALDMAYKLKGKNAPEKSIQMNVDMSIDTDDLLLAQQLLEQRKQRTISQGSSSESNGIDTKSLGGEVSN